ncbi:uncharacterized protein [Acropora muricata]|uniref:uncharacterized protein isoform X1 n=1 Tax=Acropora muricata TaxID=159855 RepID=UPI0034E5126E
MGIRLFPRTPTIYLILLLAAEKIFSLSKGNCVDFNFEDGVASLSKWTKTGHAFDDQPTFGDNAHIRDPLLHSNVQGDWWIGTFENRSSPFADGGYMTGDYPTGTLTSPTFPISSPKMSFLLGGGCAPEQIRVELLVDGKVVRQTFADDCRDRMRRKGWDVKPFKNKLGQIRLVDASRMGHISFDDFTCVGQVNGFNAVDKSLVNVQPKGKLRNDKNQNNVKTGTVKEALVKVTAHNKSDNNGLKDFDTGTDDEFIAGKHSSESLNISQKAPVNGPIQDLYPNDLLGGTTITSSNLHTHLKKPRWHKPFQKVAKLAKVPALSQLRLRLKDNSSNFSLPTDDDIRDLTCKSFLVEIKTGKPWDNDFLFSSNENYQSTRREMEVKILNIFEDDKDFRGAYFTKFSSAEEPGGVKAYFILRFRAVGKFLRKLIDQLGQGNVPAAGCYMDTPATVQCPGVCPQSCAPSCRLSCCQQYAPIIPVTQQQVVSAPVPQCSSPCPQSCAPSCQSSCCQQFISSSVTPQQPLSNLATQCPNPCPRSCAPACNSSCCQQSLSDSNSQQLLNQPALTQRLRITMSQPQLIIEQPTQSEWNSQPLRQAYVPQSTFPHAAQNLGLSGSQCPTGCSDNCAPGCSPSCCHFFDSSSRIGNVKDKLVKQSLEEEKH